MAEPSPSNPPGKIASHEVWLVPVLLLFFFLANFSIATRSPFGGFMDEVFMVDPGLNLAAGKGWNSTSWRYQTSTAFWAQNSPLYPAALSVWARVFGISMVSSRAYCYTLGMAGTFLFWLGAYRFKLLTPAYRLFWIAFLALQYSTNWMMRDERYDVWIFVGLSIAWAGAALRNPVAKYALIFFGCCICPWAGLISMTYLYLMAGLVLVLSGFRLWKEAATAVVGALAGMFSLFGFYKAMGVWEPFWKMVHTLTLAGGWYHFPEVFRVFLYVKGDYGITLMLVALAALTVLNRNKITSLPARWLWLGWSVAILLPCAMIARGMFPTMYFYMMVVPLSLAVLVPLAALPRTLPRCALTALLVLICFGGLPSRMYFAWREWDYRDPKHIREFVRAHVKPEDRVYTDYLFYFELRDYAQWYACPSYAEIIPADEADKVNIAILSSEEYPELTRQTPFFQGIAGWKKEAVFPTPETLASLGHAPRVATTYTLYRRPASTPQK